MLSTDAVAQFEREGYCLAPSLLQSRDFAEVEADCAQTLDDVCASLRAEGVLQNDYTGLPFAERYLRISRDTGRILAQHFTIALPQQGLTADTPIFLAPSVFRLLVHPRILDAVESLIGPEIAVSPVGNVRIKPPEKLFGDDSGARRGLYKATPWHQDNGVVTADADETPMITAWFPISDAPVESGCLQIIPGSHRADVISHCPDRNGELSIPGRLLPSQKTMPVPMRAGDVLFLHRRLCHASLPNVGEGVRWSFDLRYIPAGSKTGRDLFPSFVARSRAHPESVMDSPQRWAQMWLETRDRLLGDSPPPSGAWNRWDANAEACA